MSVWHLLGFLYNWSYLERWTISHNKLITLSEQQLVDYSSDYGNVGYNEGLMNCEFKYVIIMEASKPKKKITDINHFSNL